MSANLHLLQLQFCQPLGAATVQLLKDLAQGLDLMEHPATWPAIRLPVLVSPSKNCPAQAAQRIVLQLHPVGARLLPGQVLPGHLLRRMRTGASTERPVTTVSRSLALSTAFL